MIVNQEAYGIKGIITKESTQRQRMDGLVNIGIDKSLITMIWSHITEWQITTTTTAEIPMGQIVDYGVMLIIGWVRDGKNATSIIVKTNKKNI